MREESRWEGNKFKKGGEGEVEEAGGRKVFELLSCICLSGHETESTREEEEEEEGA